MYVDAILDKTSDVIRVAERVDGKRVFKEHQVDNHFFINDPKGNYKTIYGNPVKKIVPKNVQERLKLLRAYPQNTTWEIDINPILRCLENNYHGKGNPGLHVAFLDIETGFDEELGYSQPEDAFNPILSISIHLQWMEQTVCLAVPPKTVSAEQAQAIAAEVGNTHICKNEKEMLNIFLDLIEDADVLSGWNSEFYDLVYIVNRITRVMGAHETRRLCLWDNKPKKKDIIVGGKQDYTYDLSGRIHLDYMKLYKKYSYEERQSYALDNISELELGEKKVAYEGTLDQLYKKDFKKFIEYNIQDTMLLDRLDKKLKYIDLVNTIAHENTVRIQDTSGTVITTEHAIICEAHRLGLVAPNKKPKKDEPVLEDDDEEDGERAAGGWVSKPRPGLQKWIGSTDMNSLYPSVIRALNMSPETIVGQVRTDRTDANLAAFVKKGAKNTFAAFWNDKFNTEEMDLVFKKDISEKLFLDLEGEGSLEVTGAEVYKLVFEDGRDWCISANGTIFSTGKKGIVPTVLEKWYTERKAMQGITMGYTTLLSTNGIAIPDGMFDVNSDTDGLIPEEDGYIFKQAFSEKTFEQAIQNNDKILIKRIINEHRLTVVNRRVIAVDQKKTKALVEYWDKQQQVRKILLNSVYGGLLNPYHRFFDQRIGQSTTLTGRCITRHMAAMTNQVFTGEYDYSGVTICYGDTDSTYFSAYPVIKDQIENGEIPWGKDQAIDLYNDVASAVCDTFPDFLLKTLNVPLSNGKVIRSSRETVSTSGLFIKKKRYALMVYDKDKKRLDVSGKPGKLKVVGLDLRRSDIPKQVSKFLTEILLDLLTDNDQQTIVEKIREFKKGFNDLKPWEKGVPKSVNNLTRYKEAIETYKLRKQKDPSTPNPRVPGHVNASLYWNTLREIHGDKHTMKILDGSKVVVCDLKDTATNDRGSIAYPIDEDHLPEWFLELPFDEDSMMETVVNGKIKNMLGVLNWDLSMTDTRGALLQQLFDFSSLKKE